MSNRTLVELNHDYCPNPNGDKQMLLWAIAMVNYMRLGDKSCLPTGVTFKHMRHHSEPCPLDNPAQKLEAMGIRTHKRPKLENR